MPGRRRMCRISAGLVSIPPTGFVRRTAMCALAAASTAPMLLQSGAAWPARRKSGFPPRSTSARRRRKLKSRDRIRTSNRERFRRRRIGTDMTYCVGLKLKAGLVLLSDTRTNAGVDNIARFKKMFIFEEPGERVVALLAAGNLGVTQGVITSLTAGVKRSKADPEAESIMTCESIYRPAQIVGETIQEIQKRDRANIEAQGSAADATLIMAGQRKGGELRLFLIYTAGNFIEAGDDTPYLQIGEHKYGKPILDRVIKPETTLDEAIKAALVSMDSTLRSNLSVGMPLDLAVIPAGEYRARTLRIESDHKEFRQISDSWASSLRTAFHALPSINI